MNKLLIFIIAIISAGMRADSNTCLIITNNNGLINWQHHKKLAKTITNNLHKIDFVMASDKVKMLFKKPRVISPEMLKAIANIEQKDKVVIASITKKTINWHAYLQGNSFNWQTKKPLKPNLRYSISIIKQHLEPDSSYHEQKVIINMPAKKWLIAKNILMSSCKNSSWALVAVRGNQLTFEGLTQDNKCFLSAGAKPA